MDIEKIDESAFIFESYSCDVKLEISTGSRKSQDTLDAMKISIDETSPVKFAYAPGEGLIEIKNINSKRNTNLLGSLLKINKNDFHGYIEFINNYGFFFPIETDRIIKVPPKFIIKYVDRLRALTELINEVGSPNFDYRKIVELSLYLMFDEGWDLNIYNAQLHSYRYELAKLIDDPYDLPETINKQQAINKNAYSIADSLYGTYEFSSKEYDDIVNGYSDKVGWDDFRFKSLTYLYANNKMENNKEKEIIDLLFHYFYKIGIPRNISADGVTYFLRFNPNAFDGYNMIDSVTALGEYVISHEINHGIEGIRPECDIENMKSKWAIPSLSNALYFSLFYLDKKKQMLRKCEHCGLFFIVNRSTSTKKYCSSYCRNNAQQAKHRLKTKQQ